MRAYRLCYGTLFVVVTFVGAAAHAQYRCNPAPTRVDQAACLAAERGPEELRRYVERMRSIKTPIHFDEYVNEARAQAWEEQYRRERLTGEAERVPLADVAPVAPR